MSKEIVKEALGLVNKQAEDGGLWFNAHTAPEAYLQQELRKLHDAVEKDTKALAEKIGGLRAVDNCCTTDGEVSGFYKAIETFIKLIEKG